MWQCSKLASGHIVAIWQHLVAKISTKIKKLEILIQTYGIYVIYVIYTEYQASGQRAAATAKSAAMKTIRLIII